MTNTAIILAAGLGSRLRPLTDTVPKCLTEVNGKPILEQQLLALGSIGVGHIVVVVGYLGDEIRAFLKTGVWRSWIDVIENPDYATTGSAYSLWLAREYLKDGCLILEGDIVFEPAVLPHALQGDKSTWLVRKAQIGDDGCLLTAEDGIVKDVRILNEPCKEAVDNLYKSQGIVRVNAELGEKLATELEGCGKGTYKDTVIGNLVSRFEALGAVWNGEEIHIADISNLKCQEIDTRNDLLKAEKRFTQPKYVVVIMDGAADDPVAQLDNRTFLECADIPNIDDLAKDGRTGLIQTMYPNLPLGSIVAMLGPMGYNPARYYANRRASFEAIAQDIHLEEDEIAFRCNWIEVDKDGVMTDAMAEPERFWGDSYYTFPSYATRKNGYWWKFHEGRGYRNILIVKSGGVSPDEIVTKEPHENIGKEIASLYPHIKRDENIPQFLDMLWAIMSNPYRGIALFPWSPSSAPHLPSFHSRHGIDGAIISAMDFMIGIGRVARMEARRSDTMTGYSDTDLNAKVEYTKNALKYNDIVFLHINAPDEESHAKNITAKVAIIEKIDEQVIGPLRKHLDEQYPGNYRLAVLPDHYSYVETGKHGDKPVPYVIYGWGVQKDGAFSFSERSVNSKHILKSYEFMEFLRR